MTTDTTPNLADFDYIIVNSSGGKDSQAMLDYLAELAADAGVSDRVIVVHADLGRVEWEGTRQLAQKQAEQYGFRFEVVSRPQGDLLDQIMDRRVALDSKGKTDAPAWPSSDARFCTSDQKTSQVEKFFTQLVRESGIAGRPVRILNTLGIRAEESPARAKKLSLHRDSASNGKREVTRWLPIFGWTVAQVWDRINASGVPHHPAYDLGMSRLSCVFCVFASKSDLVTAAKHNPELAREYQAVEILVRSTIRKDLGMTEVIALAEAA